MYNFQLSNYHTRQHSFSNMPIYTKRPYTIQSFKTMERRLANNLHMRRVYGKTYVDKIMILWAVTKYKKIGKAAFLNIFGEFSLHITNDIYIEIAVHFPRIAKVLKKNIYGFKNFHEPEAADYQNKEANFLQICADIKSLHSRLCDYKINHIEYESMDSKLFLSRLFNKCNYVRKLFYPRIFNNIFGKGEVAFNKQHIIGAATILSDANNKSKRTPNHIVLEDLILISDERACYLM